MGKSVALPAKLSPDNCFNRYEFDENEVVLCMEHMMLEATSTEAGVKKFLVVGTSVNRGEDMSSKGNVSRLYIDRRLPLADNPLLRHMFSRLSKLWDPSGDFGWSARKRPRDRSVP